MASCTRLNFTLKTVSTITQFTQQLLYIALVLEGFKRSCICIQFTDPSISLYPWVEGFLCKPPSGFMLLSLPNPTLSPKTAVLSGGCTSLHTRTSPVTLSLSLCRAPILTVPSSNYLRQDIVLKNKLCILSRNCQSQRTKTHTVKKYRCKYSITFPVWTADLRAHIFHPNYKINCLFFPYSKFKSLPSFRKGTKAYHRWHSKTTQFLKL